MGIFEPSASVHLGVLPGVDVNMNISDIIKGITGIGGGDVAFSMSKAQDEIDPEFSVPTYGMIDPEFSVPAAGLVDPEFNQPSTGVAYKFEPSASVDLGLLPGVDVGLNIGDIIKGITGIGGDASVAMSMKSQEGIAPVFGLLPAAAGVGNLVSTMVGAIASAGGAAAGAPDQILDNQDQQGVLAASSI